MGNGGGRTALPWWKFWGRWKDEKVTAYATLLLALGTIGLYAFAKGDPSIKRPLGHLARLPPGSSQDTEWEPQPWGRRLVVVWPETVTCGRC